MFYRVSGIFFFIFGSFLAQATPNAPAKEALLIANGEYSHFGKLPNPIRDARVLSASIRQIGFSVTVLENGNREQMLEALSSFEDRLKSSRGIAFFHYGGHGVQVNGRNYLIPADADIPDERRVATRAVELEEVMTALDASKASASIVVLDACRDNPLPSTATRSATRGLSVIQSKPKNSIVIYAAEAGSKANDGLFTPILAQAITTPGRPISEIMTEVRRMVYDQSEGRQTPGEYNQLFEQLILSAPVLPLTVSTAPVPFLPQESRDKRREDDKPPISSAQGLSMVENSLPSPTKRGVDAEISAQLVSEMRAPIDELFAAWRTLDSKRYMAQWLDDATKIDLKTGLRYTMDKLKRDRNKQFPLYRSVTTNAVIKLRETDGQRATFDVWYDMSFVKRTGSTFREKARESYVVESTGSRWLIRLNRDYEKD